MTKKIIQYCSLAGLGRMTALQALGRCGFDGIVGYGASWGRWRRGLGKDDGGVGLGTARFDDVAGSGIVPGAQCHRLGEDDIVAGSRMASWAWGRLLCG
jgi:hypothetical protein